MLLTALAGCPGMDVVRVLRKMRLQPRSFKVLAAGDVAANHPKDFTRRHLSYRLEGDLPRDKVEKAINLSQDRYCPVSALLKQWGTYRLGPDDSALILVMRVFTHNTPSKDGFTHDTGN